MYIELVQYSNWPHSVTKLVRPDGWAEYRMSKNVVVESNGEEGDRIQGEEVYFEITPRKYQPTIEEVEYAFDDYWEEGKEWGNETQLGNKEHLEKLEERLMVLEMQTGLKDIEDVPKKYQEKIIGELEKPRREK